MPASASSATLPAKTESPLLIDERRRLIRELVQTQGRVTVDELAERFHTSVVTIRSDLNALAATGAVLRTHGGALAQRDTEEVPIGVKQKLRHEQKARIAAAMARPSCSIPARRPKRSPSRSAACG
jgi:DeoR family transcriptional regulator of aga operon